MAARGTTGVSRRVTLAESGKVQALTDREANTTEG